MWQQVAVWGRERPQMSGARQPDTARDGDADSPRAAGMVFVLDDPAEDRAGRFSLFSAVSPGGAVGSRHLATASSRSLARGCPCWSLRPSHSDPAGNEHEPQASFRFIPELTRVATSHLFARPVSGLATAAPFPLRDRPSL